MCERERETERERERERGGGGAMSQTTGRVYTLYIHSNNSAPSPITHI